MGYQNLIRMLKLGGKLQTSSFINQPNRALLNPEPNFLEDYLRVNGMTIISHFIHGKFYRYICDYDRNKRQKTWQLYDVIPPEDAFGYYFAKLIGTAHICDRQLAKKALKIIRKFSAAFYNDPKLLGKHNVLHNTIYALKIAIVEEIFPIKDVYQQM